MIVFRRPFHTSNIPQGKHHGKSPKNHLPMFRMWRHFPKMAGQMPELRRVEHASGKPCRARTEKRPLPILGGGYLDRPIPLRRHRHRSAAQSDRHGRTRPRIGRRFGRWRSHPTRRRPRHRQIHITVANHRQNGAKPQSAVRFRRRIRPTSRPARATFGTAHRRRKPACRNPHGSDSDGLKTASARSRRHRLHPNHVFRPNHFRPRLRVAGARMCRPTDAHGETDGHRHDTGRTRYQRRSDCRPARVGAYGRYRAVFRGRPAFQLPHDTRH